MARERSSVLVRLPATLKERLAREVDATGQSLNDVAVGILAARFAVPYQPTRRRAAAPSATGDVLLRMPPELKDKLNRRAAERRRSTNDLIVEALAERLGVSTERTPRMAGPLAANGRNGRRRDDGKVRVAVIGVGNCANSLLQGVEFYKDA